MRLDLFDESGLLPAGFAPFLEATLLSALQAEGVSLPVDVSLQIVTPGEIRALNASLRGIDSQTDVLSFPAANYPAGKTAKDAQSRLKRERDPETGTAHLGDIALSMRRAKAQAMEYGHSLLREICYLFAHGLLHLLGYDHETDEEKERMRRLEEEIMDTIGLVRELSEQEAELLSRAMAAMERAYAPYSGYAVGACVLAEDGRMFSGCNVENASFGITLCAERNAITTAVAEGARHFSAIAIAAKGEMPYPCGACRQFLREFAKDLPILITNGTSIQKTSLGALLPHSFGPESLP